VTRTPLETIADRFVDPEPDDFLEQLWERAEADALRRAKRWRAVAVALAIVAVAAVGAAAVLAARDGSGAATGTKTVDRTLACGLKTDLGTGLTVGARVNEPKNYGIPEPGSLSVAPGGVHLSGIGVFAVASRLWYDWLPNGTHVNIKDGYAFDDTVCQRTAPIPLSPSGLPRLGAFSYAGNADLGLYCPYASAPMFVRMRVTVKNNVPKAAELAVRVGRKRRPVAYIDWTPTRFTAYGSNGCLQQ
jgi:hypothetical protein